ncbi:hypothetical protein G7043_44520 [Lentzea sp. NEAU-D13]|uniref:Excreted virulence factor EspC, type VII ESX diderm n=1 Tax=Lentzea alba TaxID=2714351 RepID=A0A7C9VVU1_9PSEU|nr:hypothetical protein [Lentzea alba]NGY65974.1 hypothetical protein [Lentzea alba]
MAGSDRTHIDPEAVRSAAGDIGGLLSDMSPFQKCASAETKAGNFETATWLEDVVHNRQTSLLEHATHVKLVLGNIDDSLKGVSDTLEQTDDTNCKQLDRVVGHEVNVLKVDSYNSGKTAKEVTGTPTWDNQEYDGKSSEFDNAPPPTFEPEPAAELEPAEAREEPESDPFTMNDTIPTL